jgi:hypothetical protein
MDHDVQRVKKIRVSSSLTTICRSRRARRESEESVTSRAAAWLLFFDNHQYHTLFQEKSAQTSVTVSPRETATVPTPGPSSFSLVCSNARLDPASSASLAQQPRPSLAHFLHRESIPDICWSLDLCCFDCGLLGGKKRKEPSRMGPRQAVPPYSLSSTM